jgi:hypothetical protein
MITITYIFVGKITEQTYYRSCPAIEKLMTKSKMLSCLCHITVHRGTGIVCLLAGPGITQQLDILANLDIAQEFDRI